MSIRRKGHRKSPATKRSVVIDGRQTGVSLEDAFWSILKDIAQAQGATVSQTVTEIEKSRQRETCPPRSACSYSTGPVQKKVGATAGEHGSPNKRRLIFAPEGSG
ncbi:MAG: ribbon-helix-helix domain-containing protein [Pseudolabrys sp.]